MAFKRFEDIQVWQDARKLVNGIYKLLKSNLPLSKDFSLSDQLKRASYSVMLNIAEGFERKSKREFSQFLGIAKGSAGEVRSILYIIEDNYPSQQFDFMEMKMAIEKISSQLQKLRNYLLDQ